MNKKAKELGLVNTNFITPHGLDDPNHYTTAYELAILTNYALNNEQFAKIVNTKIKTILINGNQMQIYNTNELLGNLNGINGVKTGFTNNAGRCLVCSCTRNGQNIISVVLGADTKKYRTKDSIEIIEYTYSNYEKINLGEIIEKEFEEWEEKFKSSVYIEKGIEQNLEFKINNTYNMFPVKKENANKVSIEIQCQNLFQAPVIQDTCVGKVSILVGEKLLDELDIVVEKNVDKKGVWDYFEGIIELYSKIWNFR